MAKEINGRFYLEKGDGVEANMVDMEYDGKGGWNYKRLNEDSEVRVWMPKGAGSDGEWYDVHYAFNLLKKDPNYGKPYYEK